MRCFGAKIEIAKIAHFPFKMLQLSLVDCEWKPNILFCLPQACACNLTGSGSTACNVTTGQCSCFEGVKGRQCDACKTHFFGFKSGRGCSPCNCTPEYSENLQCNEVGVCSCKPGVDGMKCVECQEKFYNLTNTGEYCASSNV